MPPHWFCFPSSYHLGLLFHCFSFSFDIVTMKTTFKYVYHFFNVPFVALVLMFMFYWCWFKSSIIRMRILLSLFSSVLLLLEPFHIVVLFLILCHFISVISFDDNIFVLTHVIHFIHFYSVYCSMTQTLATLKHTRMWKECLNFANILRWLCTIYYMWCG